MPVTDALYQPSAGLNIEAAAVITPAFAFVIRSLQSSKLSKHLLVRLNDLLLT